MKNEIIAGLVTTIAGASMLGGGTMVLNAHRDNSVQDAQIEDLKRGQDQLAQAVKELSTTAQSLDRNVAVLTERIENKAK